MSSHRIRERIPKTLCTTSIPFRMVTSRTMEDSIRAARRQLNRGTTFMAIRGVTTTMIRVVTSTGNHMGNLMATRVLRPHIPRRETIRPAAGRMLRRRARVLLRPRPLARPPGTAEARPPSPRPSPPRRGRNICRCIGKICVTDRCPFSENYETATIATCAIIFSRWPPTPPSPRGRGLG
jgi:hypothetical protein